MKINQLAKQADVPAKTIRYYEEIGLLKPAERADNGYRIYREADVHTLLFIRRCRDLQISLEDIKTMIAAQVDDSAPCTNVDNIIKQQLERVRVARDELNKLEQSLTMLANSCKRNKVSECGILHKLTGE
ncbi:MerR family transcriptional regulator [Bowmanella yangjiangensis]|uniref:MerR family transcriptional regulator n=1 Tax=Bowmanella yangjiangensis TaxID=2811230 RepID=A0ABS3CWU0_9ALTE|nr:MerR family transcriptional regulator [Bowmanella yangjiangensis]